MEKANQEVLDNTMDEIRKESEELAQELFEKEKIEDPSVCFAAELNGNVYIQFRGRLRELC